MSLAIKLLFRPAIFSVLYFVIFYLLPINFLDVEVDAVHFYTIVISIIVAIALLFLPQSKNASHYIYSTRELRSSVYFLFLTLCFLLYGYLMVKILGTISLSELLSNRLYFYLESRVGTAWIYMTIYVILYIIMADFLMSSIKPFKLLVYYTIILILATSGGRSNVVFFSLYPFFIYYAHHRGVRFRLAGLILIFILAITIISSTLSRSGGVDSYIEGDAFLADFDQVSVLKSIDDFHSSIDSNSLLSTVDMFTQFIPRSFWEDKPRSTIETRILINNPAVSENTNYTIGIIGNAWFNFNFLYPIVIICFLIFFDRLYLRFINGSISSPFLLYITGFWVVFQIQFFRGGIYNGRVIRVFFLLTVAWIAYSFFKRVRLFSRIS